MRWICALLLVKRILDGKCKLSVIRPVLKYITTYELALVLIEIEQWYGLLVLELRLLEILCRRQKLFLRSISNSG